MKAFKAPPWNLLRHHEEVNFFSSSGIGTGRANIWKDLFFFLTFTFTLLNIDLLSCNNLFVFTITNHLLIFQRWTIYHMYYPFVKFEYNYQNLTDTHQLSLPLISQWRLSLNHISTILVESHGASSFHQSNVNNGFFFDLVAFEAWHFYGRKNLKMLCNAFSLQAFGELFGNHQKL